jgi:hypothetical protein
MKASRLSFKGDSKPYKKKKTKTVAESTPESSSAKGWIKAKKMVSGPCLIVASFPFGDAALSVDSQFKLYWSPLDSKPIEPTQVNQVFVVKTIIDSKKSLLKSCFDRHLGTDSSGSIECDKEAAGLNHQWEIVQSQDEKGFALKSYYDTFLSIHFLSDPDSHNFKKAKVKIDHEQSSYTNLSFYMQAASIVSTTAKNEVDWVDVESEKLKASHGHMLGKVKLTKEFGSGLSDAIKKGNVNETLLERRSKMKRDKVFFNAFMLVLLVESVFFERF